MTDEGQAAAPRRRIDFTRIVWALCGGLLGIALMQLVAAGPDWLIFGLGALGVLAGAFFGPAVGRACVRLAGQTIDHTQIDGIFVARALFGGLFGLGVARLFDADEALVVYPSIVAGTLLGGYVGMTLFGILMIVTGGLAIVKVWSQVGEVEAAVVVFVCPFLCLAAMHLGRACRGGRFLLVEAPLVSVLVAGVAAGAVVILALEGTSIGMFSWGGRGASATVTVLTVFPFLAVGSFFIAVENPDVSWRWLRQRWRRVRSGKPQKPRQQQIEEAAVARAVAGAEKEQEKE